MSFIAPDGRLIAWRAKSVNADLTHLGLAQTNNYSQIYDLHMAFGETAPAYAPLFARLPWRVELRDSQAALHARPEERRHLSLGPRADTQKSV